MDFQPHFLELWNLQKQERMIHLKHPIFVIFNLYTLFGILFIINYVTSESKNFLSQTIDTCIWNHVFGLRQIVFDGQ